MNGIGVSPGIAIGRAFLLKSSYAAVTGITLETKGDAEAEIEKYKNAVGEALAEIRNMISRTSGDENIEFLETHTELLSDPQIEEDVINKIREESKNANDALIEVIASITGIFSNMQDEYMRERAADIRDAGNRILKHLNKPLYAGNQQYNDNTIIITEDLAPSDTIALDLKNVSGFATQAGGKTSHTAIIARTRGIPAVAGCGDELKIINNNDLVILDGSKGRVIVNPGSDEINEYQLKREKYLQQAAILRSLKNVPSNTPDGLSIKLLANISNAEEMDEVFANCGEGIGLLRTELLFMGKNSFPNEEEQFTFYKKIALRSGERPVTIRTIDIGGDKQLPYFTLPEEQNPSMGYRAIRICLDRKDIFITQLRAILRAGKFGRLKIMFPLISGISELRAAKKILNEAKNELIKDHIPFDDTIEVGIMIEVPSAAITADILAKEVDFFSIGTNDLCQYTLAVDRMNQKTGHLYDPFNPGVLRLISNVIAEAHKHSIAVTMCGEMAADPLATPLLLGMGLTRFSMGAGSIPVIKNVIIQQSMEAAKEIYRKIMEMDQPEDIIKYLQKFRL